MADTKPGWIWEEEIDGGEAGCGDLLRKARALAFAHRGGAGGDPFLVPTHRSHAHAGGASVLSGAQEIGGSIHGRKVLCLHYPLP